MKSATLISTLTSLTTAMAVAAPIVVFGFLYVLQVQPERRAAADTRNQVEAAYSDLVQRRAQPSKTEGISNLVTNVDASGSLTTVTFDARYEQIVRFLSDFRTADKADLQSIDMTAGMPLQAGRMRTILSIHQPQAAEEGSAMREPPPALAQRRADPRPAGPTPQPPLMVSSILTSNGRRLALVEGQVVGPGDRVRTGVVQAIEADAVLIIGAGRSLHRVELARGSVPAVRR